MKNYTIRSSIFDDITIVYMRYTNDDDDFYLLYVYETLANHFTILLNVSITWHFNKNCLNGRDMKLI